LESQDDAGFDEARAELFEALGHQTRIRILQELDHRTMGFSELKHAVGLESGGLLSFHLRKLAHLVKLTPAGDYALTDEGMEALGVIGTVRSQGSNNQIKHSRPWKHRLTQRKIAAGLVVVIIALAAGVYLYYATTSTLSEYQDSLNSLRQELSSANSITNQFEKELANGTLQYAKACNLQSPFQAAIDSNATSCTPSDPAIASFSSSWYHNGSLWAALDRAFQRKWYAGVGIKVLWYRSDNGTFNQRLNVSGIRLDVVAPPLRNTFDVAYTTYSYQPSSLYFPTQGYWLVTGRVGNLSLSFVVYVFPHSACTDASICFA